MTLAEKQEWMRQKIAIPGIDEYEFLGADREIKALLAEAINNILLDAFSKCQASPGVTFGEIAVMVYGPLRQLQQRYTDYGICDSETYNTIARFWALNWDPAIYEFMRYRADS